MVIDSVVLFIILAIPFAMLFVVFIFIIDIVDEYLDNLRGFKSDVATIIIIFIIIAYYFFRF